MHRKGNRQSKNGWAETNEEAISVVQRKWEDKSALLMTVEVKSRLTFNRTEVSTCPSNTQYIGSSRFHLHNPSSVHFCHLQENAPCGMHLDISGLCLQASLCLHPPLPASVPTEGKGKPCQPWLPGLHSLCQEHPFLIPLPQLICTQHSGLS